MHRPGALRGEGGITQVARVVERVWEVTRLNVVSAVRPRGVGEQGAEGAVEPLVAWVSTNILEKLVRIKTYEGSTLMLTLRAQCQYEFKQNDVDNKYLCISHLN